MQNRTKAKPHANGNDIMSLIKCPTKYVYSQIHPKITIVQNKIPTRIKKMRL